MAKYRKKPVIIEAIKWTGYNLREVIDFTGLHPSANKWTWPEYEQVVKDEGLKIFTLEGPHLALVGDMIIKGVQGEFYSCRQDIFEATYETVKEEEIIMSRFIDNGDGTVTDTTTGLMWTKNADLAGPKTWQEAIDYIKTLYNYYTDWRLPTIKELFSLLDYSQCNPAIPVGHPFINVQSFYYWSSTTDAYYPDIAWVVGMWDGYVSYSNKSYYYYYVWPVRSIVTTETIGCRNDR